MALSIPQDASGAAISTGQGQGYAQVFNKSSFDPVEFIANLNKERVAKKQKDIDAEIALRAKNKKFFLDLPTTDKYNEWNKDEINKITNEAELKLAEFMAKGGDLEGSPEGLKIVRDLKNGLALAGGQGEAIAKAIEGYRRLVDKDPGKYDAEELITWLEGLDKIQTLDGRAKYRETTSPFKEPPFDWNEYLADVKLNLSTTEDPSGRHSVTQRNAQDAYDIVANDMRVKEVEKPGYISSVFEKGKNEGLWGTVEEMYKSGADQIVRLGGKKENYAAPKGSGGGFTINNGGGMENDKFRITPAVSPEVPGATSGNNVIHINSASGNEMKPMEFVVGGQPAFVKFADMQKTEGTLKGQEYQKAVEEGLKLGKIKNKTPEQETRLKQIQDNLSAKQRWVIKGTKAKRVTGEQAVATKNKLGDEDFFAQYEEVEGEPGTYISIIENEPINVPISSIKGERGYENFKKLISITGAKEKEFTEMMGEGNMPPSNQSSPQSAAPKLPDTDPN